MNWLSSDFHAYHKNICRGSTSWPDSDQQTRDFANEVEMTEYLIAQINKYVQPEDTLYFGGDWSFGGQDKIWKFRKRLYVRTIHFIHGNHDKTIKQNKTLRILYEDYVQMRHLVQDAEDRYAIDGVPAQNLFTTCQDRFETIIDGRMFVLDHYSLQVWNGSHKGVLHCFGHSHGTIEGIGRSMDVGVDNAYKLFGEYRPFSVEEVIRMLDKKEIQQVDHHSSSTNFAGLT